MVTNNKGVANSWARGIAARSHNGNFHTDGESLYSYQMEIGRTINGLKVLLDVHGYSMTTTHHKSTAWSAICRLDNARYIPRGAARWFTWPNLDHALYTRADELPDTRFNWLPLTLSATPLRII